MNVIFNNKVFNLVQRIEMKICYLKLMKNIILEQILSELGLLGKMFLFQMLLEESTDVVRKNVVRTNVVRTNVVRTNVVTTNVLRTNVRTYAVRQNISAINFGRTHVVRPNVVRTNVVRTEVVGCQYFTAIFV